MDDTVCSVGVVGIAGTCQLIVLHKACAGIVILADSVVSCALSACFLGKHAASLLAMRPK